MFPFEDFDLCILLLLSMFLCCLLGRNRSMGSVPLIDLDLHVEE